MGSTLLLLNFSTIRASKPATPALLAPITKPSTRCPAHTLPCQLSLTLTLILASNLTTRTIRLELLKHTQNSSQPSSPCRCKVTLSRVSRYLSSSRTSANHSLSSSLSRCPCLPLTRDASSPKTCIHLFRTH